MKLRYEYSEDIESIVDNGMELTIRDVVFKLNQLESESEKLREACKEAAEEIRYRHGDMLTQEERAHPRGSGWARVYDNLNALLTEGDK